MILPDVNVLLYALRPDAAEHARYRRWLDETVNGPAAFGVSPHVLASVVRISTHRSVFADPETTAEAFAFCRAILDSPGATLVVPGERHWAIFEDLCRRSSAAGNLAPDAWFAALAIESGCEWITNDADFARFPGLRWRRPF